VLFDVKTPSESAWLARCPSREWTLVLRENLEEQRLGLEFHPVHFVDEQHHRIGRGNGFQQGAREQELFGEDVLFEVLPVFGASAVGTAGLDTQQLLAIVPLVEGLGLVEPLVALQANEARTDAVGDGLGERRLAGTGRTLHEHGLGQAVGQERDRCNGVVT
jgi:hypothetical protein